MSHVMTVIRKGQPETFTTPFSSNSAALHALKTAVHAGATKSTFAADLVAKSAKLSDKQWAWVHKLAMDITAPTPTTPVVNVNVAPVMNLLTTAKAHLKKPAFEVNVNGTPIRISLAPDHGKNAGCAYVAEPNYGGNYYGRITPAGDWVTAKATTPAVIAAVKEMAADPVGTAAKFGHLTGRCCFCGQKLTDEKSTSVGYGPVCAKHWGLPWGAVNAPVASDPAPATVEPTPAPAGPENASQGDLNGWSEDVGGGYVAAVTTPGVLTPAGVTFPNGKSCPLASFTKVEENGIVVGWVLYAGGVRFYVANH